MLSLPLLISHCVYQRHILANITENEVKKKGWGHRRKSMDIVILGKGMYLLVELRDTDGSFAESEVSLG